MCCLKINISSKKRRASNYSSDDEAEYAGGGGGGGGGGAAGGGRHAYSKTFSDADALMDGHTPFVSYDSYDY